MTLTLPYAHLNLRRNPFGEVPANERAALAVVDVEELASLLARPPFVAQFVGEAGRGKTTHLLALRSRFPDAPYVHVGEGERPALPDGPVLFVDETQRLSRFKRRQLFRRGIALAIGTHEDHELELRQLRAPFRTVLVGGTSIDRLAQIVERRLESARRGPGPIPRIPRASLQALVDRFGDDVRAIEHELYERIQGLDEIADVHVS